MMRLRRRQRYSTLWYGISALAVSITAITDAIKFAEKGIPPSRKIRDGPKELARLLSETDELHNVLSRIHLVVERIRLGAPNQQDAYRYGVIECIKGN